MNWGNIHQGNCPKCETKLKEEGEYVVCTECQWKMAAANFFARVRRRDKFNIRRTSPGYFSVKHNSLSEREKMVDIARID